MQTAAQDPAAPTPEPEALQGEAGPQPTRRHHASLEYYLERFEAERIRESHSTGEHPPSKQSPPHQVATPAVRERAMLLAGRRRRAGRTAVP